MSSPTVVTVQPAIAAGGISIAKLVLPQALGKAAATWCLRPAGDGDAEDQHVLGEPARVAARRVGGGAAHLGGDAQREALLAEQGVAAVARAVAPDLLRLGVVDDVLGGVAGPGDVLLPVGSSGAPTLCTQGTKWPSLPSRSSTARPMRVMIFMLTATYGAVAQLDADVRDRRAERAHRERHHVHRAAAHRALEQRRRAVGPAVLQDGAHLRRRHPVVGRAGVFLAGEQMKVRSSTRATSLGLLRARKLCGRSSGFSFSIVPRVDQRLAQAVVLGVAAVAPVDVARLGQRRHVGDPVDQLLVPHVGRGIERRAGGRESVHCHSSRRSGGRMATGRGGKAV